jgi:hypothetical protein
VAETRRAFIHARRAPHAKWLIIRPPRARLQAISPQNFSLEFIDEKESASRAIDASVS